MTDKNSGYRESLLKDLKENDDSVFLYIKGALDSSDFSKNGSYKHLIKVIDDVATARGKSQLARSVGLTRQGLGKILKGNTVPSIQNIMNILQELGLHFSVKQIRKIVSDEAANILDVAQYAFGLMKDGENSTYMKLQKIVYYSEVESLMCNNKRSLFDEKILAYCAGPVVEELYHKHQGQRYLKDIPLGDSSKLSMEQKACVDQAFEKYGKYSGDLLSRITHAEDPWKKARGGLKPDERCREEITRDSMIEYYSKYWEQDPEDYEEI